MSNVFPLSSDIIVNTSDDDGPEIDPQIIELDNGDVVVNISPQEDKKGDDKFSDNLAMKMPSADLARIAEDLLTGIEADIASRSQWQATLAQALEMLALKIESPRSDVGGSGSSGTMEGMSTVRSPLLLEAVLRSQSNASGELLPSEGPAKISNDGDETKQDDQEAEALEKGFNHYLTVTAREYYPDTRRALFWSSLSGACFKKIYHDPIRRRPVSESIDSNDLIVSDAATDLASAPRVTHRVTMQPSKMKRMQIVGAYRDVALTPPTPAQDMVDLAKEGISGVQATPQHRPEDQPYNLYESYCELDLDEYAPKQFRGEGLPLPYKVTVDKDSREILEIRRFWDEDDEQCLRKRRIVKYPYIEALGIYGVGLLHIIGNLTNAMTAAVREALDAGMYASFPGFIYLASAGKQLTNEFRVPPGGGVPMQSPTGKIGDVASPLPYHDVTPGLMSLIEKISEQAQRLGGTADLPVGEGKQDAPVGTTLALIEQATKVESAVHKGLHTAQSEEFEILLDLFREDPEAFWRHNPKCGIQDKETLIRALDNCKLVPKADPNTPSHMHRLMKAVALVQLSQAPQFQGRLNVDEVLERVIQMGRLGDPKTLILPPAPQGQQAPPLGDQAKMLDAQTKQKKVGLDAAAAGVKAQTTAAELDTKKQIAVLDLQREQIIHQGDRYEAEKDRAVAAAQMAATHQNQQHQQGLARDKHGLDVAKATHAAQMDQASHGLDTAQALHDADLARRQHALETHQVLNPPPPKGPAQ